MTIKPRTEQQLNIMRKSGEITGAALRKVLENIKIGVTGVELDKIAEDTIRDLGGRSAFKTVPNYFWTICITINDQVVHGIPTDRKIADGDIVSIDIGAIYEGWYTDAAWSVVAGYASKEKKKFLQVGEQALWGGIKQAVANNTIGDISSAIGNIVEGNGYGVVRSLVGHGVGKDLHEEPEIPGIGISGKGPVIPSGATLAVEVIYTQGNPEVILENDRWTISSKDGSWGGLFEMTVITGTKGAEIITDWRTP